MKKALVIMAMSAMCTTAANAQFSGLLKKAKAAVTEKVEKTVKNTVKNKVEDKVEETVTNAANEAVSKAKDKAEKKVQAAVDSKKYKPSKAAKAADPKASDETVAAGWTKSPAYRAGFFEHLDKNLFPFQPYYTPENLRFYQWDSEEVTQIFTFLHYLYLKGNLAEGVFYPNYLEMEGGAVPRLDLVMNSYMATFLADPEGEIPYRLFARIHAIRWYLDFRYVRMNDEDAPGEVQFVPAKRVDLNWTKDDNIDAKAKYPSGQVPTRESANDRYKRWLDAYGLCYDAMVEKTPFLTIYNTAAIHMNKVTTSMEKNDDIGAYIAMTELEGIMEDLKECKVKRDEAMYKKIKSIYDTYYPKSKMIELRDDLHDGYVPAAEMPKAKAVSAALQAKANELGKKEWGDKFVKAVFTTNTWQTFKNPNFPYNITHRSMNVEVITKENGHYYVYHWVLQQPASGKSFTNDYNFGGQMVSPVRQRVNYK